MVVGEIALAAVLLIGAGLLVQAFRQLQKVDPGFRADGVLTYRIALPSARYQEPEERTAFFQNLLDRGRALPGVQGAGAASATPLGGHWGNFFEVENAPPLGPNEKDPVVLLRVATPGYLQAMGMTLRTGRLFTDGDGRPEGTRVVIVNETFAKRYWSDTPLGKRLRQGRGNSNPWMTVIGVLKDVKDYGLDGEFRPSVYVPYAQNSTNSLTVALRTAVDPNGLVGPTREVLRQLDPDLPLFQIMTMSQRLDESLRGRRTYSWLIGVFATVALLLAVSGLYGVISYTVAGALARSASAWRWALVRAKSCGTSWDKACF